MDDVVSVSQRTREEKDRVGFENAIVISSDDEDCVPNPAGASNSSVSETAAKRVKLEGGGAAASSSSGKAPAAAPSGASASDAASADPKPMGADLQPDATFDAPPALAKHPARLAGHVDLQLHALKGRPGTSWQYNWATRNYVWKATPPPTWLQVCMGQYPYCGGSNYVGAISSCEQNGDLRVEDGRTELLAALQRLSNPSNNEKYRPLVNVEVRPPLPWALRREGDAGAPLRARLDVYLEPLIFDLKISSWKHTESFYHDVYTVLEALTPVRPPVPTPRPPPVMGGDERALTGGGADARRGKGHKGRVDRFAFTTAGLMKAMESAGYAQMADPPGLELTLYGYQQQTLQWMYDRETQRGGLNALFWEERPSEIGAARPDSGGRRVPADHTFWYNKMAGELRAGPLPVVTGGFLCEEMGLGKTVEMCALLLANPYSAAGVTAGRAKILPRLTWQQQRDDVDPMSLAPPDCAATLVVCPLTLLTQWRAELLKCCGPALKVHTFHTSSGGDGRPQSRDELIAAIGDASVVLTTYEMLRPTNNRPTALKTGAPHGTRTVMPCTCTAAPAPSRARLTLTARVNLPPQCTGGAWCSMSLRWYPSRRMRAARYRRSR